VTREPANDAAEAAMRVSVATSLADIPADEWDACAGCDNPFVGHAFLSALEESGSAVAETGWLGQHVLLHDAGRLVGALPLYLKNHSCGEYVFDHGWAEAFERAGGRYYPKLQGAVPFTPVPGPRLLIRPGVAVIPAQRALIAAARALAQHQRASSIHITFPSEAEWQFLGTLGFLKRTGLQYHWLNRGYGSFEDFLASLASRKRKQIRRERREALAAGLTVRVLSGSDLKERHWDAFFTFYQETGSRKWGSPYLTRAFFSLLGERKADQVVLFLVERAGRPIAGALNLKSSETLYGRNWGASEHHPFLHFETCYYQAIDYAIAHGLARVEAGAQGEHKLLRGYDPVSTYSAHWIAHDGLREAIAAFLARETPTVVHEIEALNAYSPYRKSESD
jgi:hypothetical protein